MATLAWDQVGERFYEAGISKCVLYKSDGYGVAWNGITSVDDSITTAVQPVHFDGIKYNDILTIGDFKGVLRAFTYPDEFQEYEGLLQDQGGFYVTGQPLARFGLSYQTKIGDDVNGLETGYKIHVLYNLIAVPSQMTHQTLSVQNAPEEFEWTLSSVPEYIENFYPTSQVIFDSRKIDPYLLKDIEDILYGDEEGDAYLPSLKGLSTFIRKWERLVITDLGDGSWEAYSPLEGVINMIDETTFEIISDTAVYLNATTYEITSSEKNLEDV
jgi:hypothetical protein